MGGGGQGVQRTRRRGGGGSGRPFGTGRGPPQPRRCRGRAFGCRARAGGVSGARGSLLPACAAGHGGKEERCRAARPEPRHPAASRPRALVLAARLHSLPGGAARRGRGRLPEGGGTAPARPDGAEQPRGRATAERRHRGGRGDLHARHRTGPREHLGPHLARQGPRKAGRQDRRARRCGNRRATKGRGFRRGRHVRLPQEAPAGSRGRDHGTGDLRSGTGHRAIHAGSHASGGNARRDALNRVDGSCAPRSGTEGRRSGVRAPAFPRCAGPRRRGRHAGRNRAVPPER